MLTVSKVFLGKCGSSSLEKKHFLKESTNYFSLPQLMPLCQCFHQVKTSGHLFYVEGILVSARQIFPLSRDPNRPQRKEELLVVGVERNQSAQLT